MLYIRQIMKLLKVDEATARQVFYRMDLDFSEATAAEFKRATLAAHKELVS